MELKNQPTKESQRMLELARNSRSFFDFHNQCEEQCRLSNPPQEINNEYSHDPVKESAPIDNNHKDTKKFYRIPIQPKIISLQSLARSSLYFSEYRERAKQASEK